MARDFLIQRYCRENHPMVRGLRPFVATGPSFASHAVPGSLVDHREWRFRPALRTALSLAFPRAVPEDRWAVAEALLADGIVQALWSIDSAECLDRKLWRDASVETVALEIPAPRLQVPYDLVGWTLETLSGMSGPDHFHSYVSDDGLSLEPLVP